MTQSPGDFFFLPDIERSTVIVEAKRRAIKELLWWNINHPVKAPGVKVNKKPGWRRT